MIAMLWAAWNKMGQGRQRNQTNLGIYISSPSTSKQIGHTASHHQHILVWKADNTRFHMVFSMFSKCSLWMICSDAVQTPAIIFDMLLTWSTLYGEAKEWIQNAFARVPRLTDDCLDAVEGSERLPLHCQSSGNHLRVSIQRGRGAKSREPKPINRITLTSTNIN